MIDTQPIAMKRLDAAPESSETQLVRALADTAEARKLKVKLAAAYRILARYGLDQGIAGHISQRVPGAPEYFWVNPFGLQFSQVCADNLALINHKGELVDGWPVVNYAAFCIHGAIHHGRPDVHCAVHTHSPAGSAFSALNIPLEPLDQVCCSFYEDHAVCSEYDGVVLEHGPDARDARGARREAGADPGQPRAPDLCRHRRAGGHRHDRPRPFVRAQPPCDGDGPSAAPGGARSRPPGPRHPDRSRRGGRSSGRT